MARLAEAPPAAVPSPVRFRRPVTAFCSLLLAVAIGGLVALLPRGLDQLDRPEESLERLVTRQMELRDALARAPRWERVVYQGLLASDADDLGQAIRWYGELAHQVASPEAELARVILVAEAGRMDDVTAALGAWQSAADETSAARARDWARAAYLSPPPDAAAGRAQLEEIRADLPPGWFADRLTARLAARIGDRAAQRRAEAAIDARGRVLLDRQRVLAASELALLVLGGAGVVWACRCPGLRISAAALPPVWGVGDGYAVLVRGGVGAVLVVAALTLSSAELALGSMATLVSGLPVLGCLGWYLRVRGEGLIRVFGLRLWRGATGTLGWTTLMLIGVSEAADRLIDVGADALHLTPHWTDGFMERLLWGSPWVVVADVADSVVWAPLVEELVFRGVLYGTLRARLAPGPAVGLSALVFAAAHGYGVTGFASVFVSGVLWAVAYERTRSLWPGILAHSATNVIATSVFLTMLRL